MHSNKKVSQRRDFNLCLHLPSKNNLHRGGILTCACMLPPSSQKKSSQREDFDLGPIISKNNPHRRWILTWACVPPIISKIILLKGGFPKGGIKNQPKKSSQREGLWPESS